MGAVRSKDLEAERWNLISWAAVEDLCGTILHCEINPYLSAISHVALASTEVGQFLGGNGLGHLTHGWCHLAFAIQQQFMSAEAYKKWILSINRGDMTLPPLTAAPYYALRRLAITCNEGAIKYGVNNWLKGFQVLDLCNHLQSHLIKYINGFREEDDLGHAMWGFMTSVHVMKFRSDLQENMLGPNYTLL